MEKEYFTISEYAKLTNVSYQAVYKRLKGSFKPYLTIVEGRKYLKSSILDDFPLGESFNPSFNDSSTSVEKSSTSSSTSSTDFQPKVEEEFIRINLRNEELIDSLREQIKEKDKQLAQMNEKIISLFETNQRLLENNQSLQLNYQMLLGSTTAQQTEEETVESAPAQNEVIEEEPKKSIFKRLFGL